ncbi:hypothetical protein E3N88_38446 [Mikania micrantha]|uniref:Protein-tyrosine-phosphatase n=1 Tax=Mikania micrantha TaxID=192012 RepID=A0A5N6LU24_9ASTR|nr:hypothetical protein E3N88_38446 [Mikania micrantha]
MVGKEDESGGDGGNCDSGSGASRLNNPVSGNRKMYWRSASWSSSHVSLPPLVPDSVKDGGDLNAGNGSQNYRRPAPLTPRSNSKGRSCLPPLAIARRSLEEWPRAGSDDIGEWPIPSTPSGRDSNNNGERLKLDLSSIQRIPDRNPGLVRRDKIAFFDKECSKVAEHIFLGGDAVARDKDILKQHKITHILNCVGFVCPEYFKGNFIYRTLWLQDSPSEDITSILYDVFDYFEDVRDQGGRVFVHCCQGVSRSTSLVIAYRMWREGQSFDDAFQYVKAAREIADPNMGFACQLLQCQKRVHAFPLSPSSLLRLYRIAPHSSYDPLHLVPKMLNVPSPGALDSRGAFIMHIPSTIFIWVVLLGSEKHADSPSKPVISSSTSSLSSSSSSLSPSFSSASSPDSLSSDSTISFKCYSDSPVASPSVSSYTDALSSTVSTLSNISLGPTKLSPHSISKSSDFIDVNFTSTNSCSQSVLSPSKRSLLSIAERRGGTPKCLKLPTPSDDAQGQDACLAIELNKDFVIELKEKGPDKESVQDSCSSCFDKGDGVDCDQIANVLQGNGSSKRKDGESAKYNAKVVVLEWPSLENIIKFCSGEMDASRMYIFVIPNPDSDLEKDGDSVVYIWVGKAFRHDGWNLLDTNKKLAELPDLSMKDVIKKVLSELGLSKDVHVKPPGGAGSLNFPVCHFCWVQLQPILTRSILVLRQYSSERGWKMSKVMWQFPVFTLTNWFYLYPDIEFDGYYLYCNFSPYPV